MSLILEVLDGPQSGQKIPLETASYLNWKQDIIELGNEAPGESHALLSKNTKGLLFLESASDGIQLEINSAKVKKIHLVPGVHFKMNGISLRVIFENPELIIPSNAEPAVTEVDLGDAKPPAEKVPVSAKTQEQSTSAKKSWRSLISEKLKELDVKNSDPLQVSAFSPALELEFVKGLWSEKKIPLFFGPRLAGFGHLDLDLEDPEIPHLAFEIIPRADGGAEIINRAGFKVFLNKKPFEKQKLKNGDQIEIGISIIQVNFLENQ